MQGCKTYYSSSESYWGSGPSLPRTAVNPLAQSLSTLAEDISEYGTICSEGCTSMENSRQASQGKLAPDAFYSSNSAFSTPSHSARLLTILTQSSKKRTNCHLCVQCIVPHGRHRDQDREPVCHY